MASVSRCAHSIPADRSSPHTTSASDWLGTTFTTTASSAPTPGSLLAGIFIRVGCDRPADWPVDGSGDGEARRPRSAVCSRSTARGRAGIHRRGGCDDHRRRSPSRRRVEETTTAPATTVATTVEQTTTLAPTTPTTTSSSSSSSTPTWVGLPRDPRHRHHRSAGRPLHRQPRRPRSTTRRRRSARRPRPALMLRQRAAASEGSVSAEQPAEPDHHGRRERQGDTDAQPGITGSVPGQPQRCPNGDHRENAEVVDTEERISAQSHWGRTVPGDVGGATLA